MRRTFHASFLALTSVAALLAAGCSSTEAEDAAEGGGAGSASQAGGSAGSGDGGSGASSSGGSGGGVGATPGNTDGAGAGGDPAGNGGTSNATQRQPVSTWEPDLPTEGTFCSSLVAVECDGDEDCTEGQLCCGTLNGGSFSYDSVRCEDTCDRANGGYRLCHPGQECEDPAEECIRSLILPAYLTICNTRGPVTPEGFEGVSEASGEINCAPGLVCSGGDVCCALTSWDAESTTAQFIDGRCAPSAEQCSCSSDSEPHAPESEPTGAGTGTTAPSGTAIVDAGAPDPGSTGTDGGVADG